MFILQLQRNSTCDRKW